MMVHNIAVSAHGNQGNLIESVDPKAAQMFANETVNTITNLESQMSTLYQRMDFLEAFTRWVGKHHPEVADEYTVTTAAKERIHHGGK